MAKIKVLAGDFLQGEGDYHSGLITVETSLHPWPGITIPISSVKSLEIATTGSNKKLEDAISLGLAGALVLGPFGAAAGIILANEQTEITFWVTLKDGKKLLAATDDKTYRDISQTAKRPDYFVGAE
ncbi:hypothetical protein QN382_16255 [Pseudomonas sp. 10B1]|uniref:hypothetical protein n=1 Tax=unclassified Pseudomonas TaxID=196821 RepID=UPI002AB444D4|nr:MULTISPECIES: hypothetical protein [unclassified Pseudomonas]MDY7562268.1 hypothetical protein [Pseudomonas sp. AB6]MEA9976302.1 hypothetical protein [Pseudomonas sp. RTS4]MEA9994809.1 hypothetical protein [Pseudomonas sp. AA4]MEB0086472.1 hypothetical protein [Pseudomonas sp. RTI1]MEB0126329.1 hypothetical protein [Pseudomonas sp. CCC1.2]